MLNDHTATAVEIAASVTPNATCRSCQTRTARTKRTVTGITSIGVHCRVIVMSFALVTPDEAAELPVGLSADQPAKVDPG